ncbi:EAL domain-containing protein [Aquibium carbonis]|uniref:cyclic-guanylate-specific phosphodiesterase n=1 Tax=Aquibium carbonis TaxID=2495581 RepID=A0A3R9ZZB9_9HYPH|nr:EAL domain-containing protein [Aquibium carbonis]RST81441.1 EAL domain-containing protein [Aquibium carbonis]
MAGIAALFVSARSLKAIGLAVWLASFVLLAGLVSFAVTLQGRETVRESVAFGMADVYRLIGSLDTAFDEMARMVTGTPCGTFYMRQMRRVAFLPDGLSEFFHIEDGRVICTLSAEHLEVAHDLGPPDFVREGALETRFWLDRDLGFTGLPGTIGTIAQRGPFGTVIPPERVTLNLPPWIVAEAVLVAPDGRWWHRAGNRHVHQDVLIVGPGLSWSDAGGPAVRRTTCDRDGHYCISTRIHLTDFVAHRPIVIALVVIFAILGASWIARVVRVLIRRYWSFEARFLRKFDAASLLCAYQPILEMKTGAIAGCEVLVRWRDVDDSIVYPDEFLPIVARHGLMRRLTALLVARAASELGETLGPDVRLQVNVNIFPSELDAAGIEAAFRPLRALADRFTVALEVIESDALPLERVQREIEILRQAGYRIYLDDFGTGYSTIRHVAALDIDGVKLDKAFAMAPDGTVMAEMLQHAVCMVRSAGRKIVVEGVETATRLEQLRGQADRVDYVQGYHVCRPLDIAGFAAFLEERRTESASEDRRAA